MDEAPAPVPTAPPHNNHLLGYSTWILAIVAVFCCAGAWYYMLGRSEALSPNIPIVLQSQGSAQPSDVQASAISSTSVTSIEVTFATDTVFDPYKIHAGDKVGDFTARNITADPGTNSYPYPTLSAEFIGTTTIIGTLDTDVGISGPYISNITPETAQKLPHNALDTQLVRSIEIEDADKVDGADQVHAGDLVEATVSNYRIAEVPKDHYPYSATLNSIRLLKSAIPQIATSSNEIPQLHIVIPQGWTVSQSDSTGMVLTSPDYKVRNSLADVYINDKPTILSGQSIVVRYEAKQIASTLDAQGFVDFENEYVGDCDNCSNNSKTIVGTLPAARYDAKWLGDMGDMTSVIKANNHSDQITIIISPAITAATQDFYDTFLKSIQILK